MPPTEGHRPGEEASPPVDAHVAELRREIESLQARLAQISGDRPGGRSHRPGSGHHWLAVPLVLLSTWALSAQTTAPEDLERRVRELEERLIKGPGTATQIRAPFQVVDGAGKPILVVSSGSPGTGEVAIWHEAGRGGSIVTTRNGTRVAGLGPAAEGHGAVFVNDATGTVRAQMIGTGGIVVRDAGGEQVAGIVSTQDGRGRFGIWSGDQRVATLEESETSRGAGALSITGSRGPQVLAYLGTDGRDGGGAVRVANVTGSVTAAMLGETDGAGAVLVGSAAGRTLAQMHAGADGRGFFQIFSGANRAVAVLTQKEGGSGGLLQISSESGMPVATLTTSVAGGGYWQLNSPEGTATVEAGTLPNGRGVVRVGPQYKCSPIQAATPVMSFGLPDCILGSVPE